MKYRRVVLLLAGALVAVAGIPPLSTDLCVRAEEKADEERPVAAPRTAVLLFVSYRSRFLPPVPPTAVRYAGHAALVAELDKRGHEVVSLQETEELLRAWRVRTPESFHRDFLREMRTRLGVTRLLVAKLAVYPDRLLLHGRMIDAESMRLIWVEQAELMMIPSEEDTRPTGEIEWADLIVRLGEKFMSRLHENPALSNAAEVLALPVLAVGDNPVQADLATHSLLRALVEDGRWSLPDPALLVRELQDLGLRVDIFGEDAREALVKGFGEQPVLAARLISYEPEARRERAPLLEEEYLSPGRTAEEAAYLVVLAIDGATGVVRQGAAEFIDADDPLGLFGVVRTFPLTRRFDRAARNIVSSLATSSGGS